VRGASWDPVRVTRFDVPAFIPERHLELARDLVGGLLEVVGMSAGSDTLLEEDLVGLQALTDYERPLTNALADRLEWFGGGLEKSR